MIEMNKLFTLEANSKSECSSHSEETDNLLRKHDENETKKCLLCYFDIDNYPATKLKVQDSRLLQGIISRKILDPIYDVEEKKIMN